jgi:hypothetical protein
VTVNNDVDIYYDKISDAEDRAVKRAIGTVLRCLRQAQNKVQSSVSETPRNPLDQFERELEDALEYEQVKSGL